MSSNIINGELQKSYFNAYTSYLKQMNDYCSKSNNIISKEQCKTFMDNNTFIDNTDIQTNLNLMRSKVCLSNTDNTLNSICEKINITPIADTTYIESSIAPSPTTTFNPLTITIYCSSNEDNGYIYLPITRPAFNGLYDIEHCRKLNINLLGNLIISDTNNPIVWQSNTTGNPDIDYTLNLNSSGNLVLTDIKNKTDPIPITNLSTDIAVPSKAPFYFGCDNSLNMFIMDNTGSYIWNSTPNIINFKSLISKDMSGITMITNFVGIKEKRITAVLNNTFFKQMNMYRTHNKLDVICDLPLKNINGYTLDINNTGNLTVFDINKNIYWTSNTNKLGTAPYTLIFTPKGDLKLIDSKDVILMLISVKDSNKTGPYGLYINNIGIINIISLSGLLCQGSGCPPVWNSNFYTSANIMPKIQPVLDATVVSTQIPNNTLAQPSNNTVIDNNVSNNVSITQTNNTKDVQSLVTAATNPSINKQSDSVNLTVAEVISPPKENKENNTIQTNNYNSSDNTSDNTIIYVVIVILCFLLGVGIFIYKSKKIV